MDKLLDSVGRNFERLLRWAYPGLLFVVLLRMGRPTAFSSLIELDYVAGAWELLIVGVLGGFIAYLFQAYFFNHGLSLILQLWNYDVRVGLQVPIYPGAPVPRRGLRHIARLFDRHAMLTWRRWGLYYPEGLGNYMDYAWATYHAVFLTGWLALFFLGIREDCSVLGRAGAWKYVAPALLLLGGLWTHLHLARVPARRPE